MGPVTPQLPSRLRWADVLAELRKRPPRTVLRVPCDAIAHPKAMGASRSVGVPRGQRLGGDWRWRLRDCAGLHVQDFGDHWEAHVDHVAPSCDLGGHLRADAPGVIVAMVVGGVVAVGLAVAVMPRISTRLAVRPYVSMTRRWMITVQAGSPSSSISTRST